MHFAMKNGQICFSLRKFLAISPAIQKLASDCGCDAVVHLGVHPIFRVATVRFSSVTVRAWNGSSGSGFGSDGSLGKGLRGTSVEF